MTEQIRIIKNNRNHLLKNQTDESQFKFINYAVVAGETLDSKGPVLSQFHSVKFWIFKPFFVYNRQPSVPQTAQENIITHLFISTLLQPKTINNILEDVKFYYMLHIFYVMLLSRSNSKEQPIVLRLKLQQRYLETFKCNIQI